MRPMLPSLLPLLLLSSTALSAPVDALKPMAFLAGHGRGTMTPTAGGLDFPETQYVAEGKAITYRVRWTPSGADACEAFSEMYLKDKWVTQFKLLLKKH